MYIESSEIPPITDIDGARDPDPIHALFHAVLYLFVVTHHAQQRLDGAMLMDQGLGLIAFQLAQIVRITLEITALQQWLVNPPQIAKIGIEIGPLVIGMAIGKHKR